MPQDRDETQGSAPPKRYKPLFSPRSTTWFRLAIGCAFAGLCALTVSLFGFYWSPYWNNVGLPPAQPVLFSHRHHAGELRIDCRYCHASVETSSFAGMPATETCLSCHSQIFTTAAMLQPVMESKATGKPLVWSRVTRLPDHVYFNHSIHLAKGVGCTTCHGDVGDMALTAKGQSLAMRWCLDCHRNPGPRLRDPDQLFSPHVPPPPTKSPAELMSFYQVHTEPLTNCSTCHH